MSTLPSRTRSDSCLSDLVLDRLRVGELNDEQGGDARHHLARCVRCESRLASIDADAAEASLPPLGTPAADVPNREGAEPGGRPRTWVAAVLMTAAAAVLVLAWPRGDAGVEGDMPSVDEVTAGVQPPTMGTQAKGSGPRLRLYVRRGDAVVESSALEHWRPGDVLGFTYSSVEVRYLAVLGRDAVGTVGTYYPSGPTAARIEPGDDVAFGDGIELDDTLGEEVVYGVFCDHAVAVADLRAAIERTRGELSPPEGCTLVTLRADKRAAP